MQIYLDEMVVGVKYSIEGTRTVHPSGFGSEPRNERYNATGKFDRRDRQQIWLRDCTMSVSGQYKQIQSELQPLPVEGIVKIVQSK